MRENKESASKSGSGTDIDRANRIEQAETQSPDAARTIGGWMIVMLWLIGLATVTFAAQRWIDARDERRNGVIIGENGSKPALLLSSNLYGQYRVKGYANDQELLFLVDTGASGISIPAAIASRLALPSGRASQAITANGTITVYSTRLDTLRIGPFVQHDVDAHINPSMDGDMALLGMSFLRRYELSQREGELTITNPP